MRARGCTKRLDGKIATAAEGGFLQKQGALRKACGISSMPDPRTTEGELMCPELYPPERIAARKRDLYATSRSAIPTAAHY